jgi:HrpA-like RNA helicase
LRSLGINNVDNFPFPSPPPSASLNKAYLVLTYIGALRAVSKDKQKMSALESIDAILKPQSEGSEKLTGGLTALGKTISKFPIK